MQVQSMHFKARAGQKAGRSQVAAKFKKAVD